jgi:hypothetical protein
MTSFINIAAILVFACLVFAVVAVALRFLIPSEPHRAARPERVGPGAVRRALTDIIGVLAILVVVHLALELRFAYGAPSGERDPISVEVIEVGACERGPIGFGIARTCKLTSYRYTAERGPAPWDGWIEVVVGDPLRPGDQVGYYAPANDAGWVRFALLGSADPHWRPVSAEDRPNLAWLPTATLIAAMILFSAFRKRRAAASPSVERA